MSIKVFSDKQQRHTFTLGEEKELIQGNGVIYKISEKGGEPHLGNEKHRKVKHQPGPQEHTAPKSRGTANPSKIPQLDTTAAAATFALGSECFSDTQPVAFAW